MFVLGFNGKRKGIVEVSDNLIQGNLEAREVDAVWKMAEILDETLVDIRQVV